MRLEQALETKTKILDIAIELVKEQGLDNVTIRHICSAAGVSVGAFYHHFSSKQELVKESFMMYDEKLKQSLSTYDDDNPIDSLKKVLLDQTRYVTEKTGKLVVEYYKAILSAGEKNAVSTERAYYQAVYHYVDLAIDKELFKQSYSQKKLAEFFIKFVRGNIIDWCLHDCSLDVVNQTEEELDILIEAFKR